MPRAQAAAPLRADAQAFCDAHGKRLRGGIGGESPLDAYDDPIRNEWYAACSAGGENDYVFGDDDVLQACYETLGTTWGSTAAGEFADCVSPDPEYTGLYDMGGNVAEWEDSCDAGRTLSFPRTSTSDAIGFRCCAD